MPVSGAISSHAAMLSPDVWSVSCIVVGACLGTWGFLLGRRGSAKVAVQGKSPRAKRVPLDIPEFVKKVFTSVKTG